MARLPFISPDEDGRLLWGVNLSAKLPTHAAAVGVTPAEVASVEEDILFYTWCVEAKRAYRERLRLWTAYVDLLAHGPADQQLDAPPATLTLPAMPAVTTADIFGRLSDLGQRIKKHPGYTEAIGRDLGLIGPEIVINPLAVKPALDVVMSTGRPLVKWKKKGMSGLEIWVDRGTGVFVFLTVDTEPDYLDTAPLPATGQSVIWRYKAIYRKGDVQVGQWSDIASLSVMGM